MASSNRWRKQRPNPCIIGDAILSQIGKKHLLSAPLERTVTEFPGQSYD